jgi:hypothetical protein
MDRLGDLPVTKLHKEPLPDDAERDGDNSTQKNACLHDLPKVTVCKRIMVDYGRHGEGSPRNLLLYLVGLRKTEDCSHDDAHHTRRPSLCCGPAPTLFTWHDSLQDMLVIQRSA